jgi:D-3-phosphoglycerate dehydrogenase
MKILLSTTSFQDAPGPHHQLLKDSGFEIICHRGPLSEKQMLELVGDLDALLCGDDEISTAVIHQALPKLKVISKYGVGLDKINLETCTANKLPVLFTPGVNHTTVAEHAMALLLALAKNITVTSQNLRAGQWQRPIGYELAGKKIGIFGFGRIGQELAKRAHAFDMEIHAVSRTWPDSFASQYRVQRHTKIESLFEHCDIISLHAGLSDQTLHLINQERLSLARPNLMLINTARAELVNQNDLIQALYSNQILGYATDVLDQEPAPADHPLILHPKVIVTPHIGSRTFESVPRQALRATHNLLNYLSGNPDFIQANRF